LSMGPLMNQPTIASRRDAFAGLARRLQPRRSLVILRPPVGFVNYSRTSVAVTTRWHVVAPCAWFPVPMGCRARLGCAADTRIRPFLLHRGRPLRTICLPRTADAVDCRDVKAQGKPVVTAQAGPLVALSACFELARLCPDGTLKAGEHCG